MEVTFRRATRQDVARIVELLADDELGVHREQLDSLEPYLRAFDAVDADDRQLLVVAEEGGSVVGTLQLTFIPYLTHGGAERAQLEAVRVAAEARGRGVGHQLIRWAIDRAAARGCQIIQLTTSKRRHDAHRFYESLGFVSTHDGMKLDLTSDIVEAP